MKKCPPQKHPSNICRSYPSTIYRSYPSTIFRTYGAGGAGEDAKKNDLKKNKSLAPWRLGGKKYRLFISMLFWVFLLPLIAFGCAVPKSTSEDLVKSYASATEKTSKSKEIEHLNAKIFSSANLNIDPSDYLLGAGDLIEVKILEASRIRSLIMLYLAHSLMER